ncbi:ABC transporter permease [Paenibacillus sp. GCM10023252]|uniref:ABC transporter permease n=1 Tax=Paenibacillus sp. GCM10023252 TaxID=3252649 RepID=UPI00361A6D03
MRLLKKEWGYFRKNSDIFLFSLPGVIKLLIFAYLPMFGIMIAFKEYRYDLGIIGSPWVGLQNFEFLFQSDVLYRITRNTVVYNLIFIIVGTAAGLMLAMLLNELKRGWVKVHQTIMFIPFFLSWVVIGYVGLAFLDPQKGYVNVILVELGRQPINFYNDATYWPLILVLANLWKGIGFTTLVYYAGIMGIDPTYYEAARMDGATKRQMALRITLPALAPLISVLLILAMGGMFRGDFGLFFFLPNNSPFLFRSTEIIDTYVYRSLQSIGTLGMTAAVGLFQSVIGFILVIGSNLIVRKLDDDNALF